MPTATHDERLADLIDRAMDLATRWVEAGTLSIAEVDRFARVTRTLARALGENVTPLRDGLVDDARSEAIR